MAKKGTKSSSKTKSSKKVHTYRSLPVTPAEMLAKAGLEVLQRKYNLLKQKYLKLKEATTNEVNHFVWYKDLLTKIVPPNVVEELASNWQGHTLFDIKDLGCYRSTVKGSKYLACSHCPKKDAPSKKNSNSTKARMYCAQCFWLRDCPKLHALCVQDCDGTSRECYYRHIAECKPLASDYLSEQPPRYLAGVL